jgi:hypothetical protein
MEEEGTQSGIDDTIEEESKRPVEMEQGTVSMDNMNESLKEIEVVASDFIATKDQLENSLQKLASMSPLFDNLKRVVINGKTMVEQIEQRNRQIEIEKRAKEEALKAEQAKVSALTEEQRDILEHYAEIEGELKKFSGLVVQFDEKELKFDDVKAMLSIFTTLLEKIFQGQPHARILYALHGEASSMTRDKLKNTTGISGAMVLRAIHELAKADLVTYDEDTGLVTLVQRIY